MCTSSAEPWCVPSTHRFATEATRCTPGSSGPDVFSAETRCPLTPPVVDVPELGEVVVAAPAVSDHRRPWLNALGDEGIEGSARSAGQHGQPTPALAPWAFEFNGDTDE